MEEVGFVQDIADAFSNIPEAPLSADEWDKDILEEGRRRIRTQLMIFGCDMTDSVHGIARRYTKDLLYLSFMSSKEYAIHRGEKWDGSDDSDEESSDDDDEDDESDDENDDDDTEDDDESESESESSESSESSRDARKHRKGRKK